ncbi:MAG TPA: NAD(P)-dependent oxidoreductase [Jiangellaceae bacterium]|nr:NAD(P)-dependent oxidoreductase [Jiangellaceae bacterium]
MTDLRVGFVGTGRMGAAMVRRIADAGFSVTVYNRTRAKAEALASAKVSVADTAREAAAAADVVLVSLADDEAVRATYGGPDGLIAGLASGAVVADTSTVAPATHRASEAEVRAAGAILLDTPVSGSVPTVEQGGLTIMAGGDAAALDRIRPVFEPIAARVVHLGGLGTGATMKLAVNSIVHALDVALSEALVFAERSGIDREAAYDVIAASAVGAPFVHYKRAAFLDPEGTPVAFALDLVAKDLELAAALAADTGAPVTQLSANREVVGAAIKAGYGSADLSAVAEFLRSTRVG